MIPAFALSFSTAGISLHHFSDGEWFCIGEVPLDVEDLNAEVNALRDKAFALENELTCKLVLPVDQVRFLKVEAESADISDQQQRVQYALTEATPYSLDELVYDTETQDGVTYVAAMARQTLDEAHTFASEHGFRPIQVTVPTDEQEYPRTPEFLVEETAESDEDTTPVPVQEPPVHAIADGETPTEFRPAALAEHGSQSQGAERKVLPAYAIPAGAAAAVLVTAIVAWALISPSEQPQAEIAQTEPAETQPVPEPPEVIAALPEPVEVPETTEEPEPAAAPEPEPTEETETAEVAPIEALPDTSDGQETELSATDAAILEALKIAPTVVEEVARDPEPEPEPEQVHAGARIVTPEALPDPDLQQSDVKFLASIDKSDLSRDAVALPLVSTYGADEPFDQVTEPSPAGQRFDLDERGLVTASVEGTLNPDGVLVYLGRPAKVPPEVPVRFEQEPIEEEPSSRLAELRPNPRPANLIEQFERAQLGGRTRIELAGVRPKQRPESLQQTPQIDETPTALAVVVAPRPKPRPAGLSRPAQASTSSLGSTAAVQPPADEPGSFQPKAVSPKIPSSASVARQATIDNAINLRKLNLIGVYGTPANRRALVRLPSGRYKKLKVGDRIDGGNVIAISDSELRYQKRGQNVTLRMPRS